MTANPATPHRPGRLPNVVQVDERGGPVTLESWRHFVRDVAERPSQPPRTAYDNATPERRRLFDDARRRYHRSISDIATRQMMEAHAEIDSRVLGNEGCQPTARTGFVLDGRPYVGKSTILLRWAKEYERGLRDELGVDWDARTSKGELFVPVLYVILGENDGPKGFCQKIMSFFDEPHAKAWDERELTKRIKRLAVNCGLRVVMIDQMQNLRMSNRSAQQVAAHLKELMDVVPATFLCAGVGMEHTGFFTEGNSPDRKDLSQVGSRFGAHYIEVPDLDSTRGRHDWESLLTTVADRLVLFDKQPGDLLALSEYLHRRSGGIMGEVMDLLRLAANKAVGAEERMTYDLLSRTTGSVRSQQEHPGDASGGLPDPAAAVIGRAVQRVNKGSW